MSPEKNTTEDYTRKNVLDSYKIFDTLPEKEYDEITQLASYICESPISLITLIDEKRQFFKSHHGLEISSTPLEYSFCENVIKNPEETWIVPDARVDDRFKDNPYVLQDPNIVFYAGHPVTNEDGVVLASICVIDKKPRELNSGQKAALKALSNQVAKLMDLRRNKLELEKSKQEISLKSQRFENIIEGTNAGTWEWNIKTDEIILSDKWGELMGYTHEETENLSIEDWKGLIHPRDIKDFNFKLKRCFLKKSSHFDQEYRMKHKNGTWIWIHDRGKILSWTSDDQPLMMFGTHADITAEKLAKQQLTSVADNIPGIVISFVLDTAGEFKLLYSSKGYKELWGVSIADAERNNNLIWDTIFKEDLDKVLASIKLSAEKMCDWRAEWRIHHTNGTVKWLKGLGKPFNNHDGSTFWDAIILDVTEENTTLESLKERNKFIEKTLDNLPIGIAVNKIDTGEATIMNKKFMEVYGWPKEELLDIEKFFKKIYPDSSYREFIKNKILSDIQSGDMNRMSWEGIKITRKDGEERIVNAKNIPLADQNLMISSVIDVTEKQRSETALLEINERYNYVTQATSDCIWDWNLEKNELIFGENFELNFGHKFNKNPHKNFELWRLQLHPDESERVLESLWETLKGKGNNWTGEYRFKKGDGDYIEILDKGFILRDDHGNAVRMVGAMQDVTQQKEREQELKIFKTVLQKSKDPILITKAEPQSYPIGPEIIYANDAYLEQTGFTMDEVIGATPRIAQGPKTDSEVLKQVSRDLRAWKNIDVDVLNYKKNGEEFWVNLSIAPVANDKGWYTHWISIQKNITEAKNKELYQKLLHDVSKVFNLELDVSSSMEKVLNFLLDFGDCQMAEAWLLSSDKGKLKMVSKKTSDTYYNSFYEKNMEHSTFEIGVGLPGITWKENNVIFWEDLWEHKLCIRQKEAKKVGLKSAYGIPLKFNDTVIGVLVLGLHFDKKSLNVLETFLDEFGAYLGAEIARKQLEDELNQIINYTPDFICSFDEEGYFKRINPSFSELLNKTTHTISRMKFLDIIHPEDRELLESTLADVNKSKKSSIDLELRCLNFKKETVWVIWTLTPAVEHGITYCVGKDITDKKELEELLDQATKLAKIGSWELDLEENTVYWSDIVKEIHEVPMDYVPNLETGIQFYKEGESRNLISELIGNAIATGASFTEELQIVTPKGKEKWIKVIGEAEVINGKAVRIYGSSQDIHHRKLAELERIQILESIGDGFFAVDENWVVTYWNKMAMSILGRASEEILGKEIREVFDETAGTEFFDKFQYALKEGEPVHFEGFYKPSNIWLDVSVFPTSEGKGLTVYFKNITSRKEAIEKMKISNERFAKVVEATQDAIWDWDVRSNEVFWGNGFLDRFGHDPKKGNINLETWAKLVHKDDEKRVFKTTTDALKDINTNHYKSEYRLLKSDGSYAYVMDNACILRDEKGRPLRVIGALMDISDRKEYEDSLRFLNTQLENKAKQLEVSNAELEQFAYVTSHDLQEPLRMITSFLTLLDNKYKDTIDEKGKRYIHYAVDGAKRMRKIILELLDYSRVGGTVENMEEVDIQALLNEVLLLHKKQIGESNANIAIGKMPVINSFKSPLRQVFLNLVGNGLKYKKQDVAPSIEIVSEEREGEWCFSVKDNGIGLDPIYFEKIFIIFQRLHNRNEYSGIGMGLAITKKIVETLGGKIWVESQEGIGSTFFFTIKKR